MKSCVIYKTFKDEYKIVTQSETTAGYLLMVLPVFILSTNCTDEVLLSTIIKALDNSVKNIKAPDRSEFPSVQKNLLSALKEKSFSKLYTDSTSCEIRVQNNILTLYPNKLMTEGNPKDGLVWVKENKVVIEEYVSNLDIMVSKIHEALNHRY